jgi:hypothetical protein
MPIYQSQIQIAVGNNNTAGLVVWEALTDGVRSFLPGRQYGTYDIGETRTRLTGRPYFSGVSRIQFISAVITAGQYKYLKDTYCAGGYSGLVTINIRTDDPDTYADYNATMVLLKESELNFLNMSYRDVVISFIDLEVIP